MNNTNIVTRFAPSPTGFLHIGGARTALFNYIFTKQNNAKIILRIEDTDTARNKEEYVEGIISIFKWLNFDFNETKRQSDNFKIHKQYLEKLISEGKAYVSKEEVKEEGQRSEVIRFRNPNKIITFNDIIRGEVTTDTTDLGDFVIAKSLDEPIYHLANVVDDIVTGVNHVIRAEEHIANTPRQILIWEAINEAPRPVYGHIPLILSTDREKLSKRKHGEKVSVEYYKNNGYLQEAFVNFIAFIGWNPGGEREIYSLNEIIEIFDISKMQKGGAVFNVEKLNWYNKEYIKMQSVDEQMKYIKRFLPDAERYTDGMLDKMREMLIEKISYYGELGELSAAGEFDCFLSDPVFTEENAKNILWKKSDKENAIKNLKAVQDMLETFKNQNESNLENNFESDFENIWNEIHTFAEQTGKGDVLWPLRYALSGRDKSTDPKSLLNILGIKTSIKRIINAINALDTLVI